jgi:hypothetical protein
MGGLASTWIGTIPVKIATGAAVPTLIVNEVLSLLFGFLMRPVATSWGLLFLQSILYLSKKFVQARLQVLHHRVFLHLL